jgi:hypothetical protein
MKHETSGGLFNPGTSFDNDDDPLRWRTSSPPPIGKVEFQDPAWRSSEVPTEKFVLPSPLGAGPALTAQGLLKRVEELARENERLKMRLEEMEAQLLHGRESTTRPSSSTTSMSNRPVDGGDGEACHARYASRNRASTRG